MISGQKLRAFRERRGIGQAVVARELGVSRSAVSEMERRNVSHGRAERYVNVVLKLAAGGASNPVVARFRLAVFPAGPLRLDEELRGELVDLIS